MNDDLLGLTLGHCVIEELLGQGGMARVYRGKQENLDRQVAIKVLPPYYAADPAFVERFKLEARAMAQLSHPNIVIIHDSGEETGRLYIIMEYVAGGTLKQKMASGMMLSEVTRIIHEVASALTYAHSRGIVHRDVKPVNVLIDTTGRAVLSDFGIAKVLQTSAALTQSGAGVGTPEYMSPEQCRGSGTVDARADIYALGVMLYEMLTGHTPFEADNYTALAHSHIYESVPLPSKLNPRVSPAVQSVVMKALEKDPVDRFQKATDMAIALDQAVAAQAPLGVVTGRHKILDIEHERAIASSTALSNSPAVNRVLPPAPNGPYQQQASGLIACPACKASNQSYNRFCTTCGYSLLAGVAGVTCQACGARNAAGQRFCTACGHSLRP
ncbi:MAG: serine/threonine-protein kinase [Ktedonobacterales bacterium]